MIAATQAAPVNVPAWVAAEMPPGYRTRLLEIERLTADLRSMDAVARVLWEAGAPLRDAVATLFSALECDVEPTPGSGGAVVVSLGDGRRLLLVVSGTVSPVQKTHEELGRAFQAVQFAGANDRVVFVANGEPAVQPSERTDPVAPDAAGMLQRMGANITTGPMLFKLWRLSHEDRQKARKAIERLHSQDGGPFALPAR
jgi:hypothetical protein